MKIFTHTKANGGDIIRFSTDGKSVLGLNDVVNLWCEKERNGLGEEITYGHARVIGVPSNKDGLYSARVLIEGK
jgi:hypothetical protein